MRRFLSIIFCLLIIPGFLFAQKNRKFNYKFQKNYSAEARSWSSAKLISYKFLFKFKENAIVQQAKDGNEKNYTISSWSEATDDQTLEDCFLIFAKNDDGEKLKFILYRDSRTGLRVIENDGTVKHFYK